MTAFDQTSRAGQFRHTKGRGVKCLRITHGLCIQKGRERHLPVAHGPLARSVAANQLWSLRKLGAVWLRANTPLGPTLRPRARKLSVVMSFVVAFAMLQSTFLVFTHCTKVASAVLFFYIRRKHITTTASLSSGARSDFRRIFRGVRLWVGNFTILHPDATNPKTPPAHIRQCSPVFAHVRL
jgi:hypothetical protein